jgi:DNA-binding transcriptional LysR family regulator
MEMQQVRYFLALAATLNFTRAAEKAHISQPALTRAIQQLEAELGGPLFRRERSRTHLTELGRIMLPYLESILAQSEAAREHAQRLSQLTDATLRVGVMCTIGPAIISDFIVQFSARHSKVELTVSDRPAGQLLDLLSNGDIDLALYAGPESLSDRYHAMALFRERFVICVPPTHRFAGQNMVRGAELHDERYVNRANCEYLDDARDRFREAGATLRRVFSSERDDWVQGMIKAGMGFGFFPEFCVTDPALVSRDLIDPAFERMVQLVTVRGRPHAPAVGAFLQQARAFAWPGRARPGPDR